MVLRNHLGVIRSHDIPIHDPNIKLSKISQNGQNGQLNFNQVYDVYAITYTPKCILKGLYGLNNMYTMPIKHMEVNRGHLEHIHDPNVNLTEISQNGQNGHVNLDHI